MATDVTFRPFAGEDKMLCLGLFDANCPAHFAARERTDYEAFLDAAPRGYVVCLADGQIVGAYGLAGEGPLRRELKWILLEPRVQGSGIGSAMMCRAIALARGSGLSLIDIAASHLSAPFFARHGADVVSEVENGWGPGMHRVDMELRLRRTPTSGI
jgi:GNAT superfamily N-acetyltransferase